MAKSKGTGGKMNMPGMPPNKFVGSKTPPKPMKGKPVPGSNKKPPKGK